jgi:hypothetical protein
MPKRGGVGEAPYCSMPYLHEEQSQHAASRVIRCGMITPQRPTGGTNMRAADVREITAAEAYRHADLSALVFTTTAELEPHATWWDKSAPCSICRGCAA